MLKKVCAAMGLVMLMSGAVQAKDLTNLTFVAGAINHPTTVKVFVPFTERANAEFAGKLGITYKAANTLFKETESYNTLNNGIADFGRVRAGSFPDKIHLMGVVDLPGIAPSAVIGSKVAQELMEKFPEVVSEFPEKALPFTAWASASYQIHSVKPIKTFAELKGKTILVWDDVLGEVVAGHEGLNGVLQGVLDLAHGGDLAAGHGIQAGQAAIGGITEGNRGVRAQLFHGLGHGLLRQSVHTVIAVENSLEQCFH